MSTATSSIRGRLPLPKDDEVTPQEIAAIETVLRHIDQQHLKERLVGNIAQWFLVLKMFREFELRYTLSSDREKLNTRHRACLAAMMGFGECLLAESETLSDVDLRHTGYTKSMLEYNVGYLREKYEQWYVPVDADDAKIVSEAIQNARSDAS